MTKTRHANEVTADVCMHLFSVPILTIPHLLFPIKMRLMRKLLYLFKSGVQCEQMNVFTLIIG